MTTRETYFKGILKCQFSTDARLPIGPVDYQSRFVLEPRYRLFNAVEIQKSEIPESNALMELPYVFQKMDTAIEIYTLLRPEGFKRNAESVLLILENENQASINQDSNLNPLEDYIDDVQMEAHHYRSFSALKDNIKHGKITGTAYFTIKESIDVQGNVIDIKQAPMRSNLSDRKGCFSLFTGGRSSMDFMQGMGRGCSGSGCFNLLKWLLLLLFLLALLSMLLNKCNNSSVLPQSDQPPIHDTVYKEVIKVETDTLVLSDTLSLLDSTIKTKYEMVPLPNVQYYTGSSLMLSESAKDLEPLARYLVKHENLHATIYGHTDNVGKRQDNLKLSQDRAESVKQFLINQGVEASRLTAIGKGDTEPIRDNSKQEGRMLNRRVEVKLVEQETSETHRVIKDESNHNKQ